MFHRASSASVSASCSSVFSNWKDGDKDEAEAEEEEERRRVQPLAFSLLSVVCGHGIKRDLPPSLGWVFGIGGGAGHVGGGADRSAGAAGCFGVRDLLDPMFCLRRFG